MSPDRAIAAGAKKHVPQLDSLRGIAALMVTGYHALNLTGATTLAQWLFLPLQALTNGRTAVVIFFVLSGYVLGTSLRRSGDTTLYTYVIFCFRRFLRLWPAYAASMLLYLALYFWLHGYYQAGHALPKGWFDFLASQQLTAWTIAKNFCFQDVRLDGATWTLKVEMQVAFILPLLHWLARRLSGKSVTIVLAGLVLFAAFNALKSTSLSLFVFFAGYLLGTIHENSTQGFAAFVRSRRSLVFLAALTFLLSSHGFRGLGLLHFTGYVFATIGAVLLVSVILVAPEYGPLKPLEWQPVRFLGKISYSYYLYSLLSIDLSERIFGYIFGMNFSASILGSLLEFLLAVGLAVLFSTPSYFFIERPFIKLSGAITRRNLV